MGCFRLSSLLQLAAPVENSPPLWSQSPAEKRIPTKTAIYQKRIHIFAQSVQRLLKTQYVFYKCDYILLYFVFLQMYEML